MTSRARVGTSSLCHCALYNTWPEITAILTQLDIHDRGALQSQEKANTKETQKSSPHKVDNLLLS